MGNWITLEALRGMSIRNTRAPDRGGFAKMNNVLLVAPDVDVDVFRSQITRMGTYRPHVALFVSRDDTALDLSKVVWGGVSRLGDVDPNEEPYRTEFEREKIEVFDLTKLKVLGDNAHSRAFDDITAVMAVIEQRNSDRRPPLHRPAVYQTEDLR
jgi:esterase/lipase superfamily enzyme